MFFSNDSPKAPPIVVTDDMSLDDILFQSLARNSDEVSRHIFVEWMLNRLLSVPNGYFSRVPLDDEKFLLEDGYLIRREAPEHFILCRRRRDLNRTAVIRNVCAPDNWHFYLCSAEELEAAGVFVSMTFETFMERQKPMTPDEFRAVARKQLGLEEGSMG
jgi:hypothetical protein